MRRLSLALAVLVLAACPAGLLVAQESRPAAPPAIATARLAEELGILCSEEQAGRFGPGAEFTRRHLEERFRDLGLRPIAGESFRLPFAMSGLKGANIAGRLVAQAKDRKEGYLILSAHYDHLGRNGERYYPGACDNASGVAAMLEIVRTIDPARLGRDLVVVAFDLEERGLLGSEAFCEQPPLPLEDCRLFVTMDMLGRAGLGVVDDLLFAQGWEWNPEILDLLRAADEAEEGVGLAYFWTDIAGDRSDFVPFKRRRVPHLFFSTGENDDYHQVTDLPDRIDLADLAAQARLVRSLVLAAAARAEPWDYRADPVRHLAEFVSLKRLASALVGGDHPRLNAKTKLSATLLYGIAARVVRSGQVTEKDRAFLRRTASRLQGEMR